MRKKAGRPPTVKMKRIAFQIDERVFRGLKKLGAEHGMMPSSYARLLMEAAYSTRCGFNVGDVALTTAIRRAIILEGAGENINTIAELTGLSAATVETALAAWQGRHELEAA